MEPTAESRDSAVQVRVTVDLDSALHRRFKVVAAREGYTLSQVVRGLLENWIAKREAT
jgi:hypothetical protein